MSIDIKVRTIAFENYILEFGVCGPNTVGVLLMTDKDPTLVDTNRLVVSEQIFIREVAENGCDGEMESLEVFANRMYGEAQAWAKEAIRRNEETKALASAIGAILPLGIEA